MASILVVDDEESVRLVMERTLRRLGHDVTGAGHPRVALELATIRLLDLMVVDHRMPDMSGIELLRALRDRIGERCPPAVFVSATPAAELSDELEGVRSHVAGFIAKPFELCELQDAVAEALRLRGGSSLAYAARAAAPSHAGTS